MSLAAALTMLPALVLALVMLVRPYLGERAIARLRAACMRRPRVRLTLRLSNARSRTSVAMHGGLLIAASLAGRAPPAACAGCH